MTGVLPRELRLQALSRTSPVVGLRLSRHLPLGRVAVDVLVALILLVSRDQAPPSGRHAVSYDGRDAAAFRDPLRVLLTLSRSEWAPGRGPLWRARGTAAIRRSLLCVAFRSCCHASGPDHAPGSQAKARCPSGLSIRHRRVTVGRLHSRRRGERAYWPSLGLAKAVM